MLLRSGIQSSSETFTWMALRIVQTEFCYPELRSYGHAVFRIIFSTYNHFRIDWILTELDRRWYIPPIFFQESTEKPRLWSYSFVKQRSPTIPSWSYSSRRSILQFDWGSEKIGPRKLGQQTFLVAYCFKEHKHSRLPNTTEKGALLVIRTDWWDEGHWVWPHFVL